MYLRVLNEHHQRSQFVYPTLTEAGREQSSDIRRSLHHLATMSSSTVLLLLASFHHCRLSQAVLDRLI